MSRLNPNAGEFVPSFSAPPAAAAPAASPVAATASNGAATPSSRSPSRAEAAAGKTPIDGASATSAGAVVATDALMTSPAAMDNEFLEDDGISYEGYSLVLDRYMYSREFLLAFKPLCDRTMSGVPDAIRPLNPPQKIGRAVKGRQTYTIAELLEFQPLYQMMPEDFTWADTLGADAVVNDKKKSKGKQKKGRADGGVLSFDASLAMYFNPTEYAAAIGLYTGPPADATANGGDQVAGGAGSASSPVSPVEEAIAAKRKFAPLLEDVRLETVDSILSSFLEIPITCTHTLQELIALLFDQAIAKPALCEPYAQLCCGIADRTPEFKDGAKTINFRRLLLTKCYESLIEEPEAGTPQGQYGGEPTSSAYSTSASSSGGGGGASTLAGAGASPSMQHSWRRQCMLRNVGLIGELFRRQLLTENIMHVCVAMMLDNETTPQAEIISAACGLLTLVGDLLDGSSPASRRTMDEYFAALDRVAQLKAVPTRTKQLISELSALRASGWVKKKTEAMSPAKTSTVAAAVESTS